MLEIDVISAALAAPQTLFEPAFAQRAALAVALVSVLAAALGPTIALRDLPFYTHSLGAGAYPVLVLAVAYGVSLSLAGMAGGLVFAAVLWLLTGGRDVQPDRRDALTAIAVAAALGSGAVLASTIASGNLRLAAPPEALLFGSVLTVSDGTLAVAAAVALTVCATTWLAGDRWLAAGFDGAVAKQLRASRHDLLLLVSIALAAGATLPITGSLMAGSLLVVPAATARLVTTRASAMVPLTFALSITEGALGLYASLAFDLPTGAAIAAAAGVGFIVVATAIWARRVTRSSAAPAASLAAIALYMVVLSGCGSESTTGQTDAGPLKVVATTTQVGDIVKQVGGDAVSVTTLLPAGADPHEYEPKPSAVAALADAGVVFRSGGDIDSWLTPAVKAAGGGTKPVDLSNAAVLIPQAAQKDAFNAHWFLDPSNLAAAAQRVRDELIKADPAVRETLRANTTEYLTRVERLDEALKTCVNRLPRGDRAILTGHDDFNYLTRAFGLKIAGQLAETGESEPSVKDVQDAVDAARSGDARSLVTSRGEVSQLAVEVAKKLDMPLLELYSDSLAERGIASTALGAIAYNAGEIVKANSDGAVKCPNAPQP